MNPKRQQAIQRYIIHNLYKHLLDNNILEKGHKLELTSDEILKRLQQFKSLTQFDIELT